MNVAVRLGYLEKSPLNDIMKLKVREILEIVGDDMSTSLSNDFVTHTFTARRKTAKLKGFRHHSLLHTFATRLIELGVDVLTVSKILGHSDIKTTMVYAKVQRQTMQKAVDRLENCDSYLILRHIVIDPDNSEFDLSQTRKRNCPLIDMRKELSSPR